MNDQIPETFLITHDDYHAEFVGRTGDGRQFFLTTPFKFAGGQSAVIEYLALFLFDGEGKFVDAAIDDLGPRAELDHESRIALRDQRLSELGEITFCDIRVSPFSVERFSVEFGLIPREPEPEDDPDDVCIELHPGNYMAFFPPWDGLYDT